MIRTPTVLILGAGASQPYGYPLGDGLVRAIVELTDRMEAGGHLRPALLSDPIIRNQIDDFHERLRRSETSSIDDFLESNAAYRDIGRLCIAARLTVWGPRPDHNPRPEQHWYRYLWERLRQGVRTSQEFRENQVRIITYNYDTSLERYFADVLLATFPDLAAAGAEATRALRESAIPVVHLHGTLGEAGQQVFTVSDPTTLNRIEYYKQVAAGIRIVHDDKPSDEYATAHEWLRAALVIYFLGFGYHPTNVKRLDVLGQVSGRSGVEIRGTAFGLESAEVSRAQSTIGLGDGILHKDVNSLVFLRRYARLE